jgi:hypothetical protein
MFFKNTLEIVIISPSEYILILLDYLDAFCLSPSFFLFPPFLEALFNNLLLLEELFLVVFFTLLLLLSLLLQFLQLLLSQLYFFCHLL